MDTDNMKIGELRALAKEKGINSFGKSSAELKRELSGGTTARKSWAPADKLTLAGKDPNFRYRWVDRDPDNVQKKMAEGWELVPAGDAQHERPGEIHDGKTLDSAKQYRELVAMRLPEELGQARDEWHREQDASMKAGLKKQAQSSMSRAASEAGSGIVAPIHGNITIIE